MSAHVVTREAYVLDLRQCQRNHRHCSRLAALLVAAGLPEPAAYAATNSYSDRSYLTCRAI